MSFIILSVAAVTVVWIMVWSQCGSFVILGVAAVTAVVDNGLVPKRLVTEHLIIIERLQSKKDKESTLIS
jgi:hypothetical protein